MSYAIRVLAGLALACAVSHPAIADPAMPPMSDMSAMPMNEGYYGVGHDDWHDIYSTLHNSEGTSCCDGKDCRPTVAKRVGTQWFAKVNGTWIPMWPYTRVIEAPYSWSDTAHVCASEAGVIFCFIPGGTGG